jgi:MSHA biogenesis protein MshI
LGLFSTAKKESQIGIDFLPDGVAVAQVQTGRNNPGSIIRSEFVNAAGQEAQVEALTEWVRRNGLHKTSCVCLVAGDDCDVYQVERPEVDDSEMIPAVTWKIKDLINYDVTHAVVDSYPMPVSSKNKQQQVRVVAAREAVVSSYVDSINTTALVLDALDVHELVPSNLQAVQQSSEKSMALLTLNSGNGLLSVYHDTDLYVSRDFMIGIDQLETASSEDESVFDALLLELQRSMDYFESFYDIGAVTDLRIFPQLKITEKMAMYLQNLTNFDIDFIAFAGDDNSAGLDRQCFHAYCAALRGVNL